VTPLKLKIVLALALTDTVVRDADIISVRQPSSYLILISHPSSCTIHNNNKNKNRYLKRCTARITAPRPTRSSNFIRRLIALTNTFWKPAVRNGCLSVGASTRSRAPRVHYCLSILAHNENERRAFFLLFLLFLSFAFVWCLSERRMQNESFIDSWFFFFWFGVPSQFLWIQKLRWGLARLLLAKPRRT
jgi:hypothetical protein